MRDIRAALNGRETEDGGLSLRRLKPGDLGWIIHRQAVLYHQEYGWDWTYEGLASRILGAFVAEFDSTREDGWVAERRGAIVGSVFLMKSERSRSRQAEAALCRTGRARGRPWPHPRRNMHRAGARARLSRAQFMDQRYIDRGAPHLSGGGVSPRQRSAAPFVRPRPHRADLDARSGLAANRNRAFGGRGFFMRPRRPRATGSSLRRGARGVIELI